MIDLNPKTLSPQLPAIQRLTDARRVLEINLGGNPLLDAEGRQEIRLAKRAAWVVLAAVCEELVATLDTAAGDPDLEDATNAEDDGHTASAAHFTRGPGCAIADAGEENDDREFVDEREPEDGF